MKNHHSSYFYWPFMLYFFASIFFGVNNSWSADEKYPFKVNVITKNQADYKTPENTMAAGFSALMYNDLDWYYETLTKKSAIEDKAMFEKAGIDLSENFNSSILAINSSSLIKNLIKIISIHERETLLTAIPGMTPCRSRYYPCSGWLKFGYHR